jgi:hypothetical protein
MGHSLMSCCLRKELGFGHSVYTLSNASTCSGVYLTYLLVSICLFAETLYTESAIHKTTPKPYKTTQKKKKEKKRRRKTTKPAQTQKLFWGKWGS